MNKSHSSSDVLPTEPSDRAGKFQSLRIQIKPKTLVIFAQPRTEHVREGSVCVCVCVCVCEVVDLD
jgi:hypothetical protein